MILAPVQHVLMTARSMPLMQQKVWPTLAYAQFLPAVLDALLQKLLESVP